MRLKNAIYIALIAFGGCALHTKNVKPAAPFDFLSLAEMAKYAQAAYQDDASIRSLVRPVFNDVYIQTIASTNNRYFLATSTDSHLQRIAIAGTAKIENVLLDADFTQSY